MGAAPRHPYPKHVWSPAGGWWNTNPKNGSRNTAIISGVCVIISAGIFMLSAVKERREVAPKHWIPSSLWANVPPVEEP
eukprot:JP448458.1.p2 GENE.JP448458.1~~JP448458.1.p2  ORF type:complete len:79 (+),score=5.25 JP448458.1:38-274(+)